MASPPSSQIKNWAVAVAVGFVLLSAAHVPDDDAVHGFPDHLYRSNPHQYACQPERLHLAQSTNVDAASGLINMTISFSIGYNTDSACRRAVPVVTYGRGFFPEGSVEATHPPLQFNYTSQKSNGIFHSDYIYHMELPDLQAGLQDYWYRIVLRLDHAPSSSVPSRAFLLTSRSLQVIGGRPVHSLVGETNVYRFLTPPLPNEPTHIALLGDLGQTVNSSKTLAHIWQETEKQSGSSTPPVSHLLIAGDMSYADSDPLRWNSWFDMMEPLFRSTPVHVAAGNHEIECDIETNAIFVPYETYFRNPNRIKPAHMRPISDAYRDTLWNKDCSAPSVFVGHYTYGNAFYSYTHGPVHIIVLNSYTYTIKGSKQYQWLVEELESRVDRNSTPWLMVSFHAPLYTTFVGHAEELEEVNMKKAMEPLFSEHHVNFVVSGHDHAYMRTHPLLSGKVVNASDGPVYLTLGAGGNREGHSAGFINEEPEEFVAFRTLHDFGFGSLTVYNATHAFFKWISDGLSKEGVDDQVWFVNPFV